ncbi:carboxypeptidase regulatory-like domain-containing protein [Acinetobacter sp. TUM15064]|uniref:carboxypeptidase regulatory-like domain-containing protein n=1 Tax=Acinetobacter sp. TUM15064 TaxID=2609134 RepID=UPI00124D385D|nr:carboxypeptidase regulatory-like domain-containing protein [Acinetobacter sp. TUM15064]
MILKLRPKLAYCVTSDQIRTQNVGLKIIGSVSQKNTPIPCRVRLFEKLSGRLIADAQTDSGGNYEFNHLSETKFFIVAHHPQNQYNAVIQDNVVPK